jgi:hypothetical protein
MAAFNMRGRSYVVGALGDFPGRSTGRTTRRGVRFGGHALYVGGVIRIKNVSGRRSMEPM